ncbi:MAG: dicarboxylate/amino acid:cation symporter [Gammaproteobacteria bacterium]
MPTQTTLTTKILVALLLGLLLGSLINAFFADAHWLHVYGVNGVFHILGALFINALKMLVVPLVAFSLLSGVCGIGDVAVLGRLGIKTFALYLLTTGMAVTLALLIAAVFGPGKNFDAGSAAPASFSGASAPSLSEVLINLIPGNPVQAFASGEMLQIIVFIIIFGIAVSMAGDIGKPVADAAERLNAVMMNMVTLVMECAPLGVFCLVAKTFAEQGIGLIVPMFGYFAAVVVALLLHVGGTLNILVLLFARLNSWLLLKKIRPMLVFAFSTASSNATLPVTLHVAEKRLGISNTLASFTLPLGATVNMDGTAIMQGVATVFIANVYGIDLTLTQYVTVVAMSILASIGTAGVPGVGLIMLAMVFNQVGLPVEGIGLILGVDRLLDMLRTAVNVSGDIAVTCLVAHGEKQLDRNIFGDPEAGQITEVELPHKPCRSTAHATRS